MEGFPTSVENVCSYIVYEKESCLPRRVVMPTRCFLGFLPGERSVGTHDVARARSGRPHDAWVARRFRGPDADAGVVVFITDEVGVSIDPLLFFLSLHHHEQPHLLDYQSGCHTMRTAMATCKVMPVWFRGRHSLCRHAMFARMTLGGEV